MKGARGAIGYMGRYDPGMLPIDLQKAYKIPFRDIVNLGSNENPFPPTSRVLERLKGDLSFINRYPDTDSSTLKSKIAEYTDLKPENISIGSGANEIFDSICKVFLDPLDEVVIPLPTYTMYLLLSMVRDASIALVEGKGLDIDLEKLKAVASAAKLVFICSPNNPTGRTVPVPELLNIAEETDGVVVVDEAYQEFSGKTVAPYVEEFDNLVAVRSFSKFFGLAGLRVGYILSSSGIIDLIEKVKLPFNVNYIAQKAAAYALEDLAEYEGMKKEILKERERLIEEINRRTSFHAFRSDTNFVLVKSPRNSMEIASALTVKGIIVRDLTGLIGLDPTGEYIRITVGLPEENTKLIEALKDED